MALSRWPTWRLAQTQLEGARAQLTDLGIARAQFEHAIAVLTGQPHRNCRYRLRRPSLYRRPCQSGCLPSLLERRPDIAAAERQVAAANQQIGVAKAAFYPVISLGGSAGSQAAAIADLFASPTRFWSVGVQVAETLFDGGRRRAQVKADRSRVRRHRGELQRDRAHWISAGGGCSCGPADSDAGEQRSSIGPSVAAQQSLDISTTQYRGGLANYLQVITAQTSLLQNQRAECGPAHQAIARERVVDPGTRWRLECVTTADHSGGAALIHRTMAVVEGNDNDRSIVSPVFDAVRSSAFTRARHDRAAHVSRRPSFAHGIENDSPPRPRGIVKSLRHSVGHESTDISLDQVQLFLGIRR